MTIIELMTPSDYKETTKINRSFDKGVDFLEANQIFTDKIEDLYAQPYLNIHERTRFSYYIIALTQLENGSRINETITALRYFLINPNKSETVILLSKRKDGAKRTMVLPKLINKEMLMYIKSDIINCDDEDLCKKVRMFLTRHHKCNTHSLRYALINYLTIQKNTPLNLVAKLVGHKNMNGLIHYTQNIYVERLLNDISLKQVANNH